MINHQQSQIQQQRPSLSGWTEVFDETHQRFYYFNPVTSESVWTHPKDREQQQQNEVSSTSTTASSSTSSSTSTPNNNSPISSPNISSSLSSSRLSETKKKKKNQRRFASFADQYYLVYKKVKKMEDEKPLGYDSFTIKDKFIMYHLSYLTSVKSGIVRLAEMEKEIKESEMLFSCLRGDTQKFTELVSKHPKKLSDTLPTSKLNILHLGVASGNIHIVKYIISLLQNMKSISIDQNTFNGLTSLHISCLFGLFQIANLLIEFGGADTNVTCNCIPVSPPYLQKPLTYWNNIKDCSANSFTPFLYAIYGGSVETVMMFANLSKVGVSIEQMRSGFITDALTLACILQHVKIVDLFLREDYVFNYDPNCIDEYGMTPIMFVAMSSGNAIVLSLLLKKSASIVGVNRLNGYSCLHFAINNGNYGFIKRLCREKEGSEELALVTRTHNAKQTLNPLQYLNSAEAQNQFTPELKKKTETILKNHGGTEKKGFSDIVKEGYLTKQGHVVKNWKKRWFILRVGELQYFKSIQKLKEPTGVINLENGSLAKTYTKCCFVLYDSKNDKKFFISAASEDEMKEWWDAITFCIGGQ